MHDELPRPERKVSSFVANELILDYVEGSLDKDRAKAIEAALKKNPEIKQHHDEMLAAIIFTKKLNSLKFKSEFLENIAGRKGRIGGVVQKLSWKTWPDSLRWSSEAFLISCFVALIVYVVPWDQVFEYRKIIQAKMAASSAVQEIPPLPKPVEPEVEVQEEVKLAVAEPTPVPTAVPTKAPVQKIAEVAPPVKAVEATKPTEPVTAPVAAKKSYLYRAAMKVAGIQALTPQLVEELKKIGVIKAGSVELGWRKPNGNYFHFTVPEKNYDLLIKTLSDYGSVRVYKNPHPRKVEEGRLRFIVWIEDADTIGETPSDSEAIDQQTQSIEESPSSSEATGTGEVQGEE